MKRIIAIMIVLLFIFTSSASAGSLSEMTDEELLSMYQQIQSILLSRSDEYSLTLNAGRYIVGEDIPSGTYRLECKSPYAAANVDVYATSESKYSSDSFIMAELYNSSVVGKLDLNDGNILKISGSTIDLTCYNPAHISIVSEVADVKDGADIASNGDSFVVSPGKYHVGSEIAPGTYRLVCEDAYGFAGVNVYENSKAKLPYYNAIVSKLFGNPEIGKLELKKGNYVEIEEGSVTFYTYDGIGK